MANHRVEISTEHSKIVIPNGSLTFDWDADFREVDHGFYYDFVPTKTTMTITASSVSHEAFAILTGTEPPSENPIFDALVKTYIENYKNGWNF